MEIWQYVLGALISSSGLLAGFVLARFVKEELKAGDKYFVFLRYFILALTLGLLFYYTWNIYLIVLALIFLFMLYFNHKYYLVNCEYALLGILFYFSVNIGKFFVPGLIFIYGLPTGTRFYFHKKKWLDIATSIVIYMAVSLGLFVL